MVATNTDKNGSGTRYWLLSQAGGAAWVLTWEPELQSDTGLNDSDKTITVDADEQWEIQWIWVELTTDAAAGNRQLVIEIQDDAADVIAQVRAGIVQAASLTRYYLFAPQVTELTAFRDTDYLSIIMPKWILPSDYVVRIWDNNAVAAATDDMIVHMGIGKRVSS